MLLLALGKNKVRVENDALLKKQPRWTGIFWAMGMRFHLTCRFVSAANPSIFSTTATLNNESHTVHLNGRFGARSPETGAWIGRGKAGRMRFGEREWGILSYQKKLDGQVVTVMPTSQLTQQLTSNRYHVVVPHARESDGDFLSPRSSKFPKPSIWS